MLKHVFACLMLGAASFAQTTPAAEPPGIEDNSFLIEEGYNQEHGVVQHIQSFNRDFESGEYLYSFTQEWPWNPAPKHQLSYTLQMVRPADGDSGLGDLALNYRYQLVRTDETAFAPRFSLILPTGNEAEDRGAGGVGLQFNLPLSVEINDKLVTHWNLGTTLTPAAKNALGAEAATYAYSAGQSFILRAHPRFHLMLETVFNSEEGVISAGETQRENSTVISPGFRWAHNLKNGTQLVPGIGVPTQVGRANRGDVGIIIYFSIEHPFGKRKGS